MTSTTDTHHMRSALTLARRGLGRTWPNPSVGCIVVSKQGHVVGRARTGDGGRPHAEKLALEQAGLQAKGGSVYVSLEPCAHHGETPPCTGFLIESQVKRVVVACQDPDPCVSGKGNRQMQVAGIEVEMGVLEEEAQELNRGFILKVTQDRPLVTIKMATSSDGKIAQKEGVRTQITGAQAIVRAQLERARHDAVLVGIGTVLADDPLLTTRLPGHDHDIVRVALDSQLRTPVESQLVKTINPANFSHPDAPAHPGTSPPLWILHNSKERGKVDTAEGVGVEALEVKGCEAHQVIVAEAHQVKGCEAHQVIGAEAHQVIGAEAHQVIGAEAEALEKAGVKLFEVGSKDPKDALAALAAEGITRLLIEGGAQVATSFLEAGFCERFLHFKAPIEIGKDGLNVLIGHDISNLEKDFGLKRQSAASFGEDLLEIYARAD